MKDIMLIVLRTMAQAEPPIEHDVTLLLNGFLVSGSIISYEKYIRHHPVSAEIESMIQQLTVPLEVPDEHILEFLHLRDATFFSGRSGHDDIAGTMGTRQRFVRISLDAVQGFSLGKEEVVEA